MSNFNREADAINKAKFQIPPGDFLNFLKYLSSSGIVLSIAKTLTAPLERLKLTYQVQAITIPSEKARYHSSLSFFRRVSSEQGFRSLWRSNFINVISIIPKSIIQYLFYENVKKIILSAGEQSYQGYELFGRKIVSALICGSITLAMCYPIDVIRTRIALEQGRTRDDRFYKSFSQTSKSIRKSEGIKGLYRGFLLSNIINLPYSIIFFTSYELMKDLTQEKSLYNMLNYFGIVSFSGFIAQSFVYPLDTIRRRIQVMDNRTGLIYSSSWDCLKKVILKEGFRALYNGFGVNTVKIAMSSVIQMAIFNELKCKKQKE